MNQWLRLWHDMPTDPKFRTVARQAGQPLATVIAVYVYMLTDASANATERGRTQANDENVASALDLSEGDVSAIREAMQGRLLDGNLVTGWEKRQPKREDNSAARAKAWREAKKSGQDGERNRTQPNTEKRPDKDTEKDIPPIAPQGGEEGLIDLSGYPRKISTYTDQGINRDDALTAQCQKCGAAAGADCVGQDGADRAALHIERYMLAAHLRKAPKETKAIDWPARVKFYFDTGSWPHGWGPAPGEPGCKAQMPVDQDDPLRSVIERAGHSFIVGKSGKAWLPYNVIEKAKAEMAGAA